MVRRQNNRLVRRIFTEANGEGPWRCDECDEFIYEIGWCVGVVHHRNEDPSNNDPANLGAMHWSCHVSHHNTGNTYTRGVPKSKSHRQTIIAKRRRCECGLESHAGPVARHQKATGHTSIQL